MSNAGAERVHHPTRMAARLSRSLERARATLDTVGQMDLLADALGHDSWHGWIASFASDDRLICRGTFEDGWNRLKSTLVAAGVPERAASTACARAFAFEAGHDPRQLGLFEVPADARVLPA